MVPGPVSHREVRVTICWSSRLYKDIRMHRPWEIIYNVMAWNNTQFLDTVNNVLFLCQCLYLTAGIIFFLRLSPSCLHVCHLLLGVWRHELIGFIIYCWSRILSFLDHKPFPIQSICFSHHLPRIWNPLLVPYVWTAFLTQFALALTWCQYIFNQFHHFPRAS